MKNSILIVLIFSLFLIAPAFASVTNITISSVNGTALTLNTTKVNTSDTTPEIGFLIIGNNETYNFTVYIDTLYTTSTTNVYLNGTASNNTARKFNLTNLDNGTHSLFIEAWNTTGATGTKIDAINSSTINFTVDDTAPTINLLSINTTGNNTNTSDTTPEILFNIADNFYTINLNYTVFVNGTPQSVSNITGNNTQTRFNISNLANGTHTVQIQGRDPAGNVANSTIWNFTVDTGAPVPAITAPVNATNTSDTTPEITFNITDNFHIINLNFTVFVDGSPESVTGLVINNTPRKYNLSALGNGTHTMRVQGRDPAGNVANSTIFNFTVDDPTITINAPASGTARSDATPDVNFTIADLFYVNLTYKIWVNGTLDSWNTTTNNTQVSVNLSAQANGTISIIVEAWNQTGASKNSTALTLIIDTGPPTASLTLSTGAIVIGSPVTITCTVTDNLAEGSPSISSLELTKPIGSIVSATSGAAFTDTSDTGTYTVRCIGIDGARNTNTATSIFNATANPAGGGGPSGGGGAAPQPKATNVFSQITPGVASITKITNTDIGFKEISIEVNNPAQSVSITVTKLEGQPAIVTKSVTGSAFQYLDVATQNLQATNVKSAAIKFNVAKSWLTQHGFLYSDISLRRFADSDWQKLTTRLVGETSTEYEFEADTPGFSTFVIVGEKVAAQPTPPTQQPSQLMQCSDGTLLNQCSATKPKFCNAQGQLINACSTCGCSGTDTCNTATQTCSPAAAAQPAAKPIGGTEIAAGIVVLILLIFGFYWYYHWPKKK